MMMLDRGQPAKVDELLSSIKAIETVETEDQLVESSYLERDALLDDEFFEQSLDDFDDLLSGIESVDWDA